MRRFLAGLLTTTLALAGITGPANAQINGQIVNTKVIWDQARHHCDTDLVRFKDRWFVVCREMVGELSHLGDLRVISSADGDKWESVALFKPLTPKWGLARPVLTVTPDGQLMLAAYGYVVVPNRTTLPPAPIETEEFTWLNWFSKDGRVWSEPKPIGRGWSHYWFSRVVWNQERAFIFANGHICGNATTIQFLAHTNEKGFESLSDEPLRDFPADLSVIFDGDRAHCLLSQYKGWDDKLKASPWTTGLLGTAKAPYTKWEWKEIDTRISRANLLRLPDQRIIAVVGLLDPKDRTSLCELDLATGKLTEFLELPIDTWQGNHAGLAYHDGHVWVSYHATHAGKQCVHLAKVKLTQ